MRHIIPTGFLSFCLCLWLTACSLPFQSSVSAEVAELPCRADETVQVHDRLYFGTQKPAGNVSEMEWTTFLHKEVTPRFPEGLTVVTGTGQWQSEGGEILRERSHLLSLIYPSNQSKELAVIEIIQRYKQHFRQESVLRIRNTACVSFH